MLAHNFIVINNFFRLIPKPKESCESFCKNSTINVVSLLLYWFDEYFNFWFSGVSIFATLSATLAVIFAELRLSQTSKKSLWALLRFRFGTYIQSADPLCKIWINGLAAFITSNPFCFVSAISPNPAKSGIGKLLP